MGGIKLWVPKGTPFYPSTRAQAYVFLNPRNCSIPHSSEKRKLSVEQYYPLKIKLRKLGENNWGFDFSKPHDPSTQGRTGNLSGSATFLIFGF